MDGVLQVQHGASIMSHSSSTGVHRTRDFGKEHCAERLINQQEKDHYPQHIGLGVHKLALVVRPVPVTDLDGEFRDLFVDLAPLLH